MQCVSVHINRQWWKCRHLRNVLILCRVCPTLFPVPVLTTQLLTYCSFGQMYLQKKSIKINSITGWTLHQMWSYRGKFITLNALTFSTKDCHTLLPNFYITLHLFSESQFGVYVCVWKCGLHSEYLEFQGENVTHWVCFWTCPIHIDDFFN